MTASYLSTGSALPFRIKLSRFHEKTISRVGTYSVYSKLHTQKVMFTLVWVIYNYINAVFMNR